MKAINYFLVLFCFVLFSCSSLENYLMTDKKQEEKVNLTSEDSYKSDKQLSYDEKGIKKIISRATYDVYNRMIYNDPEGWKGKIISVSGIITEKPVIYIEKNHIQITGNIGNNPNGDYFNFIIKLDHPLPVQTRIDQNVKKIVRGEQYRVFIKFRELKDFLNDYGQVQRLSLTDCLLIYKADDFSFNDPIWVSQNLELLPNGRVTIDSIKYNFQTNDSIRN